MDRAAEFYLGGRMACGGLNQTSFGFADTEKSILQVQIDGQGHLDLDGYLELHGWFP